MALPHRWLVGLRPIIHLPGLFPHKPLTWSGTISSVFVWTTSYWSTTSRKDIRCYKSWIRYMSDITVQLETTLSSFFEFGKSEFSRIAEFTFRRQLRPMRSIDLEIDLQNHGGLMSFSARLGHYCVPLSQFDQTLPFLPLGSLTLLRSHGFHHK